MPSLRRVRSHRTGAARKPHRRRTRARQASINLVGGSVDGWLAATGASESPSLFLQHCILLFASIQTTFNRDESKSTSVALES